MAVLLVLDTAAIVFLVCYIVMKGKEKPKEEKPAEKLSDSEVQMLKQVVNLMGYIGEVDNENKENS